MEEECKNYNPNVVNIGGCKMTYSKGEVQISNTKWLNLKNKENNLIISNSILDDVKSIVKKAKDKKISGLMYALAVIFILKYVFL